MDAQTTKRLGDTVAPAPTLLEGGNAKSSAEQMRRSIEAAGLPPPDHLIADGRIHRFPTNGKCSDSAGWYVLFDGNLPAGRFGCWRTGVDEKWRADSGRRLSASEAAEHRKLAEAMMRMAQEDRQIRRTQAKTVAATLWDISSPARSDHPYLQLKGIGAHGLRQTPMNGDLLVPVRDAQGTVKSIQTIDASGSKRFHAGAPVAGGFHTLGESSPIVCIAEGYATAASIFEATSYQTVVAFNASNLIAVAKGIRDSHPDARIVVCADDDIATPGNPGLKAATDASRAVGAVLALPDFGPDRPAGATDFNDMARLRGPEAVRTAILVQLEPQSFNSGCLDAVESSNDDECASGEDVLSRLCPDCGMPAEYPDCESCGYEFAPPAHKDSTKAVTDVTGVPANGGAEDDVTPGHKTLAPDVTPENEHVIPSEAERPYFCVFDEWVKAGGSKFRPGVWYFGMTRGTSRNPPVPTQQWVCSPLYVEAITFDAQEHNFGRLLRFKNSLGRWREWAMPMELLRGSGDDLRGELLATGVEIDPMAKALLANYLQAKLPKRRMRCALQVGWCGQSFVLPDTVIGPEASGVIFQSGERGNDEHTLAGTLMGWQTEIAARAVRNPLLLLALSAAFAGPVLARCNAEGGGIHFVGDSSTGKTTAIEAACSVWGGPNFRRSWRATANGMEGVAALFNDCLLALDEISECDPREVGAIVYALGNGRGKQRATRSGSARSIARWRCSVLSSGERTIGTTMEDGGHRVKAGQSVRLLDLSASRRHGAWDDLHQDASGTAFSDALKRAAAQQHGYAGRAFLEKFTRDPRDMCELLDQIKARPGLAAAGDEGQDKRTAARFALLALAGELATEYGITMWPAGAAIEAAIEGFRSWLTMRGRGNDERRQVLERVSAFLERHGDSRFSAVVGNEDTHVRDRAGWWRDDGAGRTYLFTKDGLREALKGFDFKRALDLLQAEGALVPPGANGERSKPQRIGGRNIRLYQVVAEKLLSNAGT